MGPTQRGLDSDTNVRVYPVGVKIGEVATQTGVSVRAIRHYDRVGLLASVRAENRYRIFTEEDVQRVRLIRLFLSVGFGLEEIKAYAPCFQTPEAVSQPVEKAEALAFFGRKLADIDAQMAALHALRARLEERMHSLEQ